MRAAEPDPEISADTPHTHAFAWGVAEILRIREHPKRSVPCLP